MSTELNVGEEGEAPIPGLNVTSFDGGQERGPCLQLTITTTDKYGKYIQLDRDQVLQLTLLMVNWLGR